MIDWAIIGGGLIFVAWVGWLAFWPRKRREDKTDDHAVALPDGFYGFGSRMPPYPDVSPSAEEIAERVHEHERARELTERAECLLKDVIKGHKPDQEEIEFLNEFYHGTKVNSAIISGMWAVVTESLNEVASELEALKAAQPTLIVAEMPERVG